MSRRRQPDPLEFIRLRRAARTGSLMVDDEPIEHFGFTTVEALRGFVADCEDARTRGAPLPAFPAHAFEVVGDPPVIDDWEDQDDG